MKAIVKAAAIALAAGLAGCASGQVGPVRSTDIEGEVAYIKPLAEPNLELFVAAAPAQQAALRNQIVTARMYLADIQYHYYEARLTREMQEEGLGGTLAALGLTTASTLVSAEATKTILSGTAAAVIGADKAYNERQLLNNSIQALQTQMRADRKTQAATIYAKMYRPTASGKADTPIGEYTLPMALSDADTYYQAGTIASAMVGLSRTVAYADQNATQAQALSGPNPAAVVGVTATAIPLTQPPAPLVTDAVVRPIRTVSEPLHPFRPVIKPGLVTLTPFEKKLSSKDFNGVLARLCLPASPQGLGPEGSPARSALSNFLVAHGQAAADRLTENSWQDLQDLALQGVRACP